MKSIDLSRFPIHIVQDGSALCIPACVQAILLFHDRDAVISQFELLKTMLSKTDDNLPSLGAVKDHIGPLFAKQFTFDILFPSTFDEWLKNIKNEVDNSCPLAFSTKLPSGDAHIRIAVGHDDSSRRLLVYNPGLSSKNLFVPNSQTNIVGGCSIVCSGLQEYAYSEAQSDWNKPDRCDDQLTIHPTVDQ